MLIKLMFSLTDQGPIDFNQHAVATNNSTSSPNRNASLKPHTVPLRIGDEKEVKAYYKTALRHTSNAIVKK
jgi:hypothetical protein